MNIRLPAEWEKQSAILIAWPYPQGDFQNNLVQVEQTYKQISEAIIKHQELIVICQDEQHQQYIQNILPGFENFIQASYDDIWVRDTSPIPVMTNSGYQLINFQFNGWGDKYPHQNDNNLYQTLSTSRFFHHIKIRNVDMILEGGSIESDGQGTLLTTKQCLLSPNRNPHLNQQQIEQNLEQAFSIKRILWLDQPNLAGDDTDAHIDTLARFCSSEHIVYSSCDNPNNPNFSSLKNMETQLKAFRTTSDFPYQLTALPLPTPIYNGEGKPLPANYANFLILNNAVLVPVYEDPMDQIILEKLGICFPDREIIAISCLPLIQQYGSLHCMSMQIPA